MQAIQSRILPCTNTLPTRIRAWCARGSLTKPIPDHVEYRDAHRWIVGELLASFAREDAKAYAGTTEASHHWGEFASGQLPCGDWAYTLVGRGNTVTRKGDL